MNLAIMSLHTWRSARGPVDDQYTVRKTELRLTEVDNLNPTIPQPVLPTHKRLIFPNNNPLNPK